MCGVFSSHYFVFVCTEFLHDICSWIDNFEELF